MKTSMTYRMRGTPGYVISEEGIVYNPMGLRVSVLESTKGSFVLIDGRRRYIDRLLERSKDDKSYFFEPYQGNDLPWKTI